MSTLAITQSEIAKMSGVSIVTANRALQGRKDVAPATRARVMEIARKHGYRVNAAARAMRSGRFGQIGMLVSSNYHRGIMSQQTLWGIEQELRERKLLLCLGQMPDAEVAEDNQLPRILSDWSVDGLFLSYTWGVLPELVKAIELQPVPSVWINTKLPYRSVRPDDFQAGRSGTQNLLEMGHRRIAYMGLTSKQVAHYSEVDRAQGYRSAMKDAGLEPFDHVAVRPTIGPDASGFARSLLDRRDRPSAVVCYSNVEASLLLYAAAQAGLSVPKDLSIVTVSDELLKVCGPTVATVLLPGDKIAREAVRMLMEQVEGNCEMPESSVIPCTFARGDTLAARSA